MAVTLYEEEQAAPSRVREYTEEPLAPEPPKKGRGLRDELVRQLGLTARNFATIPTAVGGAVADFGYGATNLAKLAAGQEVGNNPPSQQYQQALTRAGLPEASGPLEKVVEFFSQAVGGGLDPAISGITKAAAKIAPQGFQPAATTAKGDVVRELHDAGLKLPASEMSGGKVSRSLEGFGGSTHTATAAKYANQPRLQALAAAETKLDPKNLTEAAIKAASSEVWKEGYAPIKALGTIRTGRLYKQELAAIAGKNQAIDDAAQLTKRLDNINVSKMTADDALEHLSQIRADATDAFRADKSSYGRALRAAADALEKQIERNLPANSELLTNFRAARVQLAKNNAVREMLVDPHTGLISTAKAAKQIEHGVPLTGKLATIAKAGSKAFVNATDAPLRGEGTPLNLGDAAFMGGGGALGGLGGFLAGGPAGAAAGSLAASAAVPVLRSGARKIVLSKPMQAYLARQMGAQPSLFGAPASKVAVGAQPQLADIAAGLFPTFSQGAQ